MVVRSDSHTVLIWFSRFSVALMKRMWGGAYARVDPRDFKHVIGKFAPQFSGYAQHDAQELLAFLLDGLHEDLNKYVPP